MNKTAEDRVLMRRFAVHLLLLEPIIAAPSLAQQAIRFEAPGAYLEVADSHTLSTTEFTIEFWLRVRELGNPQGAGGEQTIFDKRGAVSGYNFRLAGEEFVLGRRVRIVTEELLPAGQHFREIDATGWSSGVYYYELAANDHRDTRRMVVVRN